MIFLLLTLYSNAGKSGVVAQRLAASLSSVGVAASFVHGAEWGHGDLGGCGMLYPFVLEKLVVMC